MSQPTYLDEKSERDHSMSVKRGTGEAFTPRDALQDSHTMVKAIRLKSSPQGCSPHPLVRTLDNNAIQCPTPSSSGYSVPQGTGQLLLGGHGPNEDRQEDERTTYRVLRREKVTEHGMPYRPRGPGVRSAHSSPSVGKPRTWRRGAGDTDSGEQGGTRDARR